MPEGPQFQEVYIRELSSHMLSGIPIDIEANTPGEARHIVNRLKREGCFNHVHPSDVSVSVGDDVVTAANLLGRGLFSIF